MEIDFNDQTGLVETEDMEQIRKLLLYAAEKEEVPANSEVSLTFVDNKEIQELNRMYRQKDSVTDVISFALEEDEEGIEIVGEDIPLVLGDIIISVERAKEQAVDYGHSLEREMGFLALHGLLHLLGYDHMEEEEEKEMFSRQKEILNAYGLSR